MEILQACKALHIVQDKLALRYFEYPYSRVPALTPSRLRKALSSNDNNNENSKDKLQFDAILLVNLVTKRMYISNNDKNDQWITLSNLSSASVLENLQLKRLLVTCV